MLYTFSPENDYDNILHYLNEFSKKSPVKDFQIDTRALLAVCMEIRAKFPHIDGVGKASVFKKMGYFVSHFLYKKPVKSVIPCQIGELNNFDINAVIALEIAIYCIQNSSIEQDAGIFKISNPIYISNHSYADIIQALSQDNIEPKTHYHLLTLYFEQLTYKTNRDCEYPPDHGPDHNPDPPGFYTAPFSVTDGDDMAGV